MANHDPRVRALLEQLAPLCGGTKVYVPLPRPSPEAMKADRQAGMKLKDIARRHGTSIATVSRKVR